jgi:hypothetical protein
LPTENKGDVERRTPRWRNLDEIEPQTARSPLTPAPTLSHCRPVLPARPAQRIALNLGCKGVSSSPIIAKLSVSGVGLRTHTGVAIRMFRALAEAGINLEMINTSEVRVNVVVDGLAGEEGLTRLQTAFADVLK